MSASTHETLTAKSEKLLLKHFPVDWDHIIITSKKQMIRGDVLVDDAPHNLIGGDYQKILMSAPHNMAFPEKEYGMQRVHNWLEAYGVICTIANT